jgi:hypothetical protein
VAIKVGAGATAEWLPQESIVFAGAEARMRTEVDLGPGARYLGWKRSASAAAPAASASTRAACNSPPTSAAKAGCSGGAGQYRRRLALLDSPIGLAGYSVCSTVLAAGIDLPMRETLAACRNGDSGRGPARRPASAPCPDLRRPLPRPFGGSGARVVRHTLATLAPHRGRPRSGGAAHLEYLEQGETEWNSRHAKRTSC